MKSIKVLSLCLTLLAMQATAQEDNFRLWMDGSATVTADGTTVTYLTVSQNDPDHNYLGFNLELTLPVGFKINQVKNGRNYVNDITISERKDDHTISCNMPDAQTLKVACISLSNQPLYPDDMDGNPCDLLFTVGIVAESSTINGVYDVEMSGISFTYRESDNSLVDKTIDKLGETCTVTVTGGTDFGGVDYIIPDESCGTMILPFDCSVPEGMTVYSCDEIVDNSTLNLSAVSTITANTPYVVSGTPGNYHFEGTYRALKARYATAYMTGVYETTEVPEGAYVMQNHKDTYGVGFYRVGSVKTSVNAYRGYLNDFGGDSQALRLNIGDITGIDGLKGNDDVLVNVYNAQGQLIRTDVEAGKALKGLSRGIYIINDKKYIIE